MKNYCTTHHLYYEGIECPMCVSDRANAYSKKFRGNKSEPKPSMKEDKKGHCSITKDILSKLVEKFNHNSKNKKN